MHHIAILGAGAMGTAMSVTAASRGHKTTLIGTENDDTAIAALSGGLPHPRLNTPLPDGAEALPASALPDVLRSAPDLVIVALSSTGTAWATAQLARHMRAPAPVLMLAKGLLARGGKLVDLTSAAAGELRASLGFDVPFIGVGGPAIALEQAAKRETSVVFAGHDRAATAQARDLLQSEAYRITASADMRGVELCAAFKNILAIGVGAADGLMEKMGTAPNGAQHFNLTAGFFSQAVRELAAITAHFGGERETVWGLAGVGDLFVTCNGGRNARLGRAIGSGLSYAEAMAGPMKGETVEGADLALEIAETFTAEIAAGRLAAADVPLTRAVIATICKAAPFPQSLSDLEAGLTPR